MGAAALRILVVDDHALVREAVAAVLHRTRQEWEISLAAGGEDALWQLDAHPVEVAVTDYSMPGLCGIELVRRMHARWPGLGILVLSMHADALLAVRALQAGASGYVSKTQAGSTLVDAIEAVAAGRWFVSPDIEAAIPVPLRPLANPCSGRAGPGRGS